MLICTSVAILYQHISLKVNLVSSCFSIMEIFSNWKYREVSEIVFITLSHVHLFEALFQLFILLIKLQC